MKGVHDLLDKLEASCTAGRRSLVREIRGEVERLRRERDAAREALRADPEARGLYRAMRAGEGFLSLVERMRSAQRAFFRGRRKATPEESMRLLTAVTDLEREVDRYIAATLAELPLFDREESSP